MAEESTLSNLYGDEEPIEAEAEVVEEPEKEPEKEPEREGEPEPEKEPAGSPPDPDDGKVPLSALTGERSRRQEAERRAEELEKKLKEQAESEPISFLEDEKGARDQLLGTVEERLLNQSLNDSEALARREFTPKVVDEAVEWFKESRSTVLQQRFQETTPILRYHEIVAMHQEHQELEKMKDLPAYQAQIRAEVEAKVRAELEAEASEKQKLRDSIPTSLAGEPSKEGLKGSEWKGPTPDEEIYGD